MPNEIDLKQVGQRLGMVVARYPGGKEAAATAGSISTYTLDRYLSGSQNGAQILAMARICRPYNINIMWLLYGTPYSMTDTQQEVTQ